MTRTEAFGYVQLAVGVVGIVVSILSAPAALLALQQITVGGALPVEFQGVSGGLKLFAVIFVLTVMLFLVLVGLSIVLGSLANKLHAHHPYHAAAAAVTGVFLLALGTDLVAFHSRFFVPVYVGSVTLFLMSVRAGGDPDIRGFWNIGERALIFIAATAGGAIVASSAQSNGH